MKARELIPFLVAAQVLTLLVLLVILAVLLSWKRSLDRRSNQSHQTIPIRRVS